MDGNRTWPGGGGDPLCAPHGVTELALLVSPAEVEALERAAARRGLSAGTMLRQLIDSFLRKEYGAPLRPRP